MNLNKYLECTCTKIKPRLLETDEIKRIFEDLLLYILEENDCEPVILYEIYSTQVYPRYIRIDKKDYIIWDNYFWDLYRHFLIICFSVGDLKKEMEKQRYIDYSKSLMLMFLSSRFEKNPSLSRYIAEEYKRLSARILLYDKKEMVNALPDEKGYMEYFDLGRIFGYCHELAHIAFNRTSKLSFTVENKIVDYCNQWLLLMELNKKTNLTLEDDDLKNVYTICKKLVKNQDGKILEEISCDVIAMYTIVTYFEIQGIDKEEIGNKIVSIEYLLFFNWWLSSNERYWNVMRKIYEDPVANDNAWGDEESTFVAEVNSITEELSVRTNFTFMFLSEFAKIPMQSKRVIDKMISEGVYDLLNQANGYDIMERVLTKYSVSYKDFKRGENHIRKRNSILGWDIE